MLPLRAARLEWRFPRPSSSPPTPVFLDQLDDESGDLFLLDPPYFAVRDPWDREWKTADEYSAWLVGLRLLARRNIRPRGSQVLFNGIGRHEEHPLFDVIMGLERGGWFFRNWITCKQPRALRRHRAVPPLTNNAT